MELTQFKNILKPSPFPSSSIYIEKYIPSKSENIPELGPFFSSHISQIFAPSVPPSSSYSSVSRVRKYSPTYSSNPQTLPHSISSPSQHIPKNISGLLNAIQSPQRKHDSQETETSGAAEFRTQKKISLFFFNEIIDQGHIQKILEGLFRGRGSRLVPGFLFQEEGSIGSGISEGGFLCKVIQIL